MLTFDQIAASQLLQGKALKQALVSEASHAIGSECPECDSRVTEDNGGTEYRCCNCDHRWGYDSGERYGF